MDYKNILITGGAGFVGSNLALRLKDAYREVNITAFDNLKRRGSEINIPRLKERGIAFVHGDIRNRGDLEALGQATDLILECSAEPSVLAGTQGSPEYLIDTNLAGTINCLEVARKSQAAVIFLSTSRVYPIRELESLEFRETETRFEWDDSQKPAGASSLGITEEFPLGKARSLYGATKLASEFIFQEYQATYGLRGVINRCGVITGPWQMGKIDQGVIVLWLARHFWCDKPLSYIGYGGTGKQVRDFIHIDDLFEAVRLQIEDIKKYSGETYNIGGGRENSLSLLEMTKLCQEVTGHEIEVQNVAENRPNDVRIYISDCRKFQEASGWQYRKNAKDTFNDIYIWLKENEQILKPILN